MECTEEYLESLLLADNVLPLSQFFEYHHESPINHKNKSLILDAQTLENLEILEVETKNGKTTKGSLLALVGDK